MRRRRIHMHPAFGELIVEVDDDLGEGGFVFLHLTDEELRDVQQALRV